MLNFNYFGNLFNRTTPDPYRNSNPSNTQFTINGYLDIDRRESDRGNLYVSDTGDSHPGTVILKSTPGLQNPSPGPDSKRTGYYEPNKPCCPVTIPDVPEEEEPEDEETCIELTQVFLDSLPSPADYRQQLLDMDGPCSPFMMYLCNYYPVTIYHYQVGCTVPWGSGGIPCCEHGCCGLTVAGHHTWCEVIVFPNCEAAQQFAEAMRSSTVFNTTYCVGDEGILSVVSSARCDDDLCRRYGCMLFGDRLTPMAYTSGSYASNCGQLDLDGNGQPDRESARENNSWGAYIC